MIVGSCASAVIDRESFRMSVFFPRANDCTSHYAREKDVSSYRTTSVHEISMYERGRAREGSGGGGGISTDGVLIAAPSAVERVG